MLVCVMDRREIEHSSRLPKLVDRAPGAPGFHNALGEIAPRDNEGWPAAVSSPFAEYELRERDMRRHPPHLNEAQLQQAEKHWQPSTSSACQPCPVARIEALAAGDWLDGRLGRRLIAIR